MKHAALIIILLLSVIVPVSAIDIYVPGDQPTIGEAVMASKDGDVIRVADGTYTGLYNRSIPFMGKAITIRSENGPDNCIIDCEHTGNGFLFFDGETETSILDGFTITNGGINTLKAGIEMYGASPIIRNCIVTHCDCGGIRASQGSNPTITNCETRDNYDIGDSGAGGIDISASYATIDNCIVTGNQADNHVGGVRFNDFAGGTVSNTIISNNTGYDASGFGGVKIQLNSTVTFKNCTIQNNVPGGIMIAYQSMPSIIDCTITDNINPLSGGGIYIQNASSTITGCEIARNQAHRGGGIYLNKASGTIIGGSVIDQNTFADNIAGTGIDLYCHDSVNPPINAAGNVFSGYHLSDYYVNPMEAFDLTDCTSQLTPVTADVYVSPNGSDTNDGLSADHSFKTIHHACSVISATETQPLTVHLAEGTYSPSATGEFFPIPLMNHVTLSGSGMDLTVLDAEESNSGLDCIFKSGSVLRGLTVRNGVADSRINAQSHGGGLYIQESDVVAENCRFSDNMSERRGGGWRAIGSELVMLGCRTDGNVTLERGGGYYCENTTAMLFNCLIDGNTAEDLGAAGMIKNTEITMMNCTLTGNSGINDAALYCVGDNTASVTNCIFRENAPEEIGGDSLPNVTYSNIDGGFSGTGNIDADPLFTTCALGDYFLSHTACGQSADSPCIDAGSAAADTICADSSDGRVCMHQTTSRTDELPDDGIVDMGFHYPAPSTCDTLGCTIDMPSNDFGPGDTCYCNLLVCNTLPSTIEDATVFAILGILDMYYFAPSFGPYDHYTLDLEPGENIIEVLPGFTWPPGAGSFSGAVFYGAMTNAEVTEIIGEMDAFTFGWHE